MRSVTIAVLVLVGVIALLVIGILAGRVGGVAIRSQGALVTPLTITVSEPVLRGVPTVVRWDQAAAIEADVLTLVYRDASAEHAVGQAHVREGRGTITLPCQDDGGSGSIVLKRADTGQVVAWQEVVVAAPGPECVR